MYKSPRKIVQKIAIGALVACIGLFVVSRITPLLQDARVVLSALPEQTELNSPVLHISGKAIHAKTVALNGTPIVTLPDGRFEQTLLLSPGYNSLTFDTTGTLGKLKKQTHAIVLKETDTGEFAVSSFPIQN